MLSNIQIITDRLTNALQNAEKPVALHEPEFAQSAWEYVKECIDTGWVSSAGKYVEKFAQDLSDYTGLYAIPVMNGTAALHLCMYMAGVRHDEEVLTPTLTFVATANAVSYLGATPHFIDCEKDRFSLDIAKLEKYLADDFSKTPQGVVNKHTGKLSRVLIVTHIFGHIEQMERLIALCSEYNLILIEDAAEALGSFYNGKHAGHFGTLSALSFNGNKIVTTGGGGAVLTPDKALAVKALHLSTTAKVADPYSPVHDQVAYNYRMPNINAALGCSQLEGLKAALINKKKLAQHYQSLLQDIDDINLLSAPKNCDSNYWLNALIFNSEAERNALIDSLSAYNIQTRGVWRPMHQLPMYKDAPSMDCSQAESLAARTVNLPSSAFLID